MAFVVALIMAISTASFAMIAVLWQEDEPLARAAPDASESREATGSPIEHDAATVEPTRARAGKWI